MAARELRLAGAGDALITRKLVDQDDEDLETVLDRIRSADVGVVNLEMLLHDYEGYPASNDVARFSGTYLRAPPWAVDELSAAGFDLFAAASNHTGDYSHGGMLATMRELEERNVAYSGLGRSLADAREPAYVDTPAGRVALVSACSTVTPGTEAGEQLPAMQGRPGLAPLRLTTRYVLPDERLEQLRKLSDELGLEEMKRERKESGLPAAYDSTDGIFHLLHVSEGHDYSLEFEVGDEPRIYQEPREDDVRALLTEIRRANRQADWVVVSLHAHEGENGHYNDPSIATFIRQFARRCVDEGANVFVGHGPHTVRGVEIYEGAPLFYSLGNFVCQYEAIPKLPGEAYDRFGLGPDATPADVHEQILTKREYWESVVPICTFSDGRIEEIELLPVDLGYDGSPIRHGRPRLADGETAERIVERVADRSAPFDTDVAFEEGVGLIRPD